MSSLTDRLAHIARPGRRSDWTLWNYQLDAGKFVYENPFSALFIDTGLGKTVIMLTLIARLIEENIGHKVLVVAPVRVAAQGWPNEIDSWEHTCWLDHTVIRAEDDDPEVISARKAAYENARFFYDPAEAQKIAGKAATAKKEELRLARMREPTSVHIINREALTWLIDQYSEWKEVKRNGKIKRIRKIVGWPYKTVILDESSGFKDHKTRRYKALVSVRAQGWIDRLHELTATPAAESYMGLFAQVFLMDRGQRLGQNITAYREEHFDYNRYTHVYKIKPGHQEIISDRIADLALVMKSKDYLEEEDPRELIRPLDMTAEEMALYRRMERNFIMTLPDGEEIEAQTAASLSSKLLQIASGAVYNDQKQARNIHEHKLEDLAELAEELAVAGLPLVVGYWYKPTLARLKKRFPKAKVIDKAGKLIKEWNDGKVEMLLLHPQAAGHGLNLQYGPGRDMYLYDACWSYELYYQWYRRLHRQGQKYQVNIHLPQMRGTLDEYVMDRLRNKQDAQEVLFDRIRAMRKRFKNMQELKMAA